MLISGEDLETVKAQKVGHLGLAQCKDLETVDVWEVMLFSSFTFLFSSAINDGDKILPLIHQFSIHFGVLTITCKRIKSFSPSVGCMKD